MDRAGAQLTAAGATRVVTRILGDLGKADVQSVRSEKVGHGPSTWAIRTRVDLATWHTDNDRDDIIRAIKRIPGYEDHTTFGKSLSFRFR